MKKVFRAHPLMILSFIKPFLFILLIPVIRGVAQYLDSGVVTEILGIEIILFCFITLFAVLRWYFFRLECDEKTVTIKTGVFTVQKAVIPISGLSSVQSEQTPFDYIVGSVTFRINTEAGSRDRTDYSFKLSRRDSHKLSDLLYGKKSGAPVRFSPVKIAILAAATSSAFTGMLVGVPILNNAAKLLGLGFEELFEELTNISNKFETYFPPIVNTVTLVLLCGYIISFIYSFLRYLSFRLFLNDDRIEVRSGFFVKLRTSFKKASVNNVKIEQTFLMLLLRRYAMKVNVGGYGEAKSESQVLIPSGRYGEIRAQFSDYFPFLKPTGSVIRSKKGLIHKNRYLFWAEIFFLLLGFAAGYSAIKFQEFGRFIVFMTFILGCVIFYYAYLCISEYSKGMARFGETVFASGKKGLRRCQLYCPKDRVGEIKLIRFPPDLYFKTCKVKITVRSETADSITLRHLNFEDVKREIFKCYNIG